MIERTRNRGAKSSVSVWGVGGSGGHAVAALIAAGVASFDMIVADGDLRVLAAAPAPARVRLAPLMCHEPGAGHLPSVFADAATRRATEAIAARLDGFDLCIVVAGLDDATARVAAPLVATTARARGIKVLAILVPPTAPDDAAGQALAAIEAAADHTLFVRPPRAGRANRSNFVATGAALGEALTELLMPILVGGPRGAEAERGVAAMQALIERSARATRKPATPARRAGPAPRIGAAYRTGHGPELMPLRPAPTR
jgi:hypothetical protein